MSTDRSQLEDRPGLSSKAIPKSFNMVIVNIVSTWVGHGAPRYFGPTLLWMCLWGRSGMTVTSGDWGQQTVLHKTAKDMSRTQGLTIHHVRILTVRCLQIGISTSLPRSDLNWHIAFAWTSGSGIQMRNKTFGLCKPAGLWHTLQNLVWPARLHHHMSQLLNHRSKNAFRVDSVPLEGPD